MSVFLLNINSNGQITLPSRYRNIWNLKPNTKVKVKISKNKTISFIDDEANNLTLDDLPSLFDKIKPISDEKIKQTTSESFNPEKN